MRLLECGTSSVSPRHPLFRQFLGEGIFRCEMQLVAEDTGVTRWLLRFYQNYVLLVTTKPEVANPNVVPPW